MDTDEHGFFPDLFSRMDLWQTLLRFAQKPIEPSGGLPLKSKLRLTCACLLFSFVLVAPSFQTTATNQDQPTIAKDSVQVTAFTFNVYKGNYDVWSWVPRMHFRVNGPIASGSQLYVEYTLPTGAWVKFYCYTATTEKGYW